jgi:hypothetical protein
MIEAVDYALLLGEMEGVYAKLKHVGELCEVELLAEMKAKYYKKYFALLKEERQKGTM